MNNTLVLYLKALSAFTIPLLSGFGGMLALYVTTGMPEHWKIVLAATACSSLVAALSGLTSFLSRSFSDSQDAKDIANGNVQTATAVVTQVAEPKISGPVNPDKA